MKRKLPLAAALVLSFGVHLGKAAVVNINANVVTADGFTIQDQSGASLVAGSLVKIGVFVNTTSGAGLTGSAITSLFTSQSSFSAGRDSLLASFVEVGEGRIDFGYANGLGTGAGGALGDLTGVSEDYPAGAVPLEYGSGFGLGTFKRNWVDNTLQIQNSNVGIAPFNSIANTKLNGLQLSVIAFNGSTIAGSTELLVARNSVSVEALPSADGEVSNFGLDTASELLVGKLGTDAFQTIPEPGTSSLVWLASAFILGHRRLRIVLNQS